MLVMLVMLVMPLLLLLLPLQGTDCRLLAIAAAPIDRTTENRLLASVAATLLLGHLKGLSAALSAPPGRNYGSLHQSCPDHCEVVTWLSPDQLKGSFGESCCGYRLSFRIEPLVRKNEIRVERTKSICACIINRVINVSCIALTLCSTTWTKIWQDPKVACLPGQQTLLDDYQSEGNEYRIDCSVQWSVIHSHVAYAIEVCPVNIIPNFSGWNWKLTLLNWSSRQRLNKEGTLNRPHKHLWGK